MHFTGQTLSADPRTIKLILLALRHMPQVNTLRIVFGHLHISDALIRCLFDRHRVKSVPVRRLWLENCHISAAHCLPTSCNLLLLPQQLDYHGLESIRFRRLPMRPRRPSGSCSGGYVYARGSSITSEIENGAGSYYEACVNITGYETCAPLLPHRSQGLAETTGCVVLMAKV